MKTSTKRRLQQYSAAAGTLLVAGPSVAAEQMIAPKTIFASPSQGDFFYDGELDVNDDGIVDYYVFGWYDAETGSGYITLQGSYIGGSGFNEVGAEYDGSNYVASPLTLGSVVDGSLTFSPSNFPAQVYIFRRDDQSGSDVLDFFENRGYIGLRFDIPGNSPHFACMEILVEDANENLAPDLQILGGVFDDVSNTPVTCQMAADATPVAVPVNGLTFLLGAGLLGTGALLYNGQRRRRRTDV